MDEHCGVAQGKPLPDSFASVLRHLEGAPSHAWQLSSELSQLGSLRLPWRVRREFPNFEVPARKIPPLHGRRPPEGSTNRQGVSPLSRNRKAGGSFLGLPGAPTGRARVSTGALPAFGLFPRQLLTALSSRKPATCLCCKV
jgi:hypothetical protein